MPLESKAVTSEQSTPEAIKPNDVEKTNSDSSEPMLSLGSILSQKFAEKLETKHEKTKEQKEDKKPDIKKTDVKVDKDSKKKGDELKKEVEEKKLVIPESVTKGVTKIDGADESGEEDNLPEISQNQPEDVRKAFKTLREKLKDSQNKIKEFQKIVPSDKLEQEINKVRSEKEELAKQIEEYESYLRVHKLEGTKEYKNLIANPLNEIRDNVKALAAKYEVRASEILDALGEEDRSKRNELLANIVGDFNEVDKMDLLDMSRQYAKKIAEDKYLRDNAKEAIELLEGKTKEKERIEIEGKTQAELKAMDSAWKQLSDNVPIFKKTEDNVEWNEAVDSIEKTAREVKLGELQPTDVALMKYQALAFPLSLKVIHTLSGEIESLKKSLSEYQKGEPSSDKMSDANPSDVTDDNKGLTFAEIISKKAFN